MKTFVSLFVLGMFLTCSVEAQWYQQNSGTTENLWLVQFTDVNNGWVLNSGYQKLYKTTDGGESWILKVDSSAIFSFYFLDENNGWYAARPWAIIYKTADGGTTWIQTCYISCAAFSDLNFIDNNVGFAITYVCLGGNKLFKTNDGGFTWSNIHISDSVLSLNKIDLNDSNNIVVSNLNSIFITSDGGVNWVQRFTNINGNILDVDFITPFIGWGIINSKLYKTTNGGVSWIEKAASVNAFHFVNETVGWYSSGSSIYRTDDGGISWVQQNLNNTNPIKNFFFINQNIGWAVGDDGTILHTINGGLPVELASFSAARNEDHVLLSWTTASETNNKGFEVERSIKNSKLKIKNFEPIGFVNGKGTSTELNYYSFKVENLSPGKYLYRLKQIDYDGSYEYSNEIEVEIGVPDKFVLYQNYPNPFNPTTKIKYSIPSLVGSRHASPVQLKIYDILGTEIATLVNEEQTPGIYDVKFDGGKLTSDVYFYRLIIGNLAVTKKMIYLR